MSVTLATWIAHALELYLLVGVLFAVPFAWRGVGRIDPTAREGTWGFRLLIVPGAALLWPLLAGRWLRGVSEPPTESNAHRRSAEASSAGGEP